MARLMLGILLASTLMAGGKERDWQNGRLLWRDKNPYFEPASEAKEGSTAWVEKSRENGQAYSTSGPAQTSIATHDEYVIESTDAVYLIQTTRLASTKATPLDWNLKFAVDKKKLIVVDANGKEMKADIVKEKHKTLSQSAPRE